MTFNKGSLSQLQEILNSLPPVLLIQLWVISMVMCALLAIIVRKGVLSQPLVLQVELQEKQKLRLLVCIMKVLFSSKIHILSLC